MLVAQFVLAMVVVTAVLRLWQLDLRVPFNYWGDSIFELMLAKSIADGGWIWSIQRLGAPFGLAIAAFPQNLVFSSLVMKAIAIFTSEPGLILNLFWLFSIGLTSLICHAALRPFGLTRGSVFVFSTLYALLPHVFFRNIAHISLTYMFVPVICAQALIVLSRCKATADGVERGAEPRLSRPFLVLAALAIGTDYIYNAFFSCFFLSFAGIAAYLSTRNGKALAASLSLVALIGVTALVNLSPSLWTWHQQGPPATIDYKGPAEAEYYGLKIRHLVSPVLVDILAPEDVTYPLENENAWAKLGGVGGVGFVLALGAALFASRTGTPRRLWAAGVLAMAGVLLATVGGFGAIFNVLITPDIRAYNRIVVFIAFFAFYTLFHCIEWAWARFGGKAARPSGALFGLTLAGIFAIGVVDQGAAGKSLVENHDTYRARFDVERAFVARVEQSVPDAQQVFQLPIAPFPGDPGREDMWPYDHGRPYLWSNRFKWSWPALTDVQTAFESQLKTDDPAKLLDQLVKVGFDGLWIDRAGYRDGVAEALERRLTELTAKAPLVSDDERYAFFDLGRQAREWATAAPAVQREERQALTEPVLLGFDAGFYGEEVSEGGARRHRWSGPKSKVKLRNTAAVAKSVVFTTTVQASAPSQLTVVGPRGYRQALEMKGGEGQLTVAVTLEPHERAELALSLDGPRILAPGDKRTLHFVLINPSLKPKAGKS